MRVLAFLVLASAALAQAEVSSEEEFRGELESVNPGRRVRYVLAPVVRFSEQNRRKRWAVPVRRVSSAMQKVGDGPNPGGWNPWAPPDFNRPYEKKWPEGTGRGYCCLILMPWSPGGALPAGRSEALDPVGVDQDGDGTDDFNRARAGEANGSTGSGLSQSVNYFQ